MLIDSENAKRNGFASDFDVLHEKNELRYEDDLADDNEEMAFSLATILFLVLGGIAVVYIFGSIVLALCKGNL